MDRLAAIGATRVDRVPRFAAPYQHMLCKIFIVNFSQHLVMAQKPFSDILCQVLKSPINAIKSRNFKVDFINESAYNKTSGA